VEEVCLIFKARNWRSLAVRGDGWKHSSEGFGPLWVAVP